MKKLNFLFLLIACTMFVSCDNEKEGGPELPELYSDTFYGALTYNGVVVNDIIECNLLVDDGVASVTLCGVSFSPMMPAMDITVPSLDCEKKSKRNYLINGTGIIPTVGGADYTAWEFESVEAELLDGAFTLTMHTVDGKVITFNDPGIRGCYKGRLVFDDFVKNNVEVDVDVNTNGVTVVFNDAQFAINMPPIDITLINIPLAAGDGFAFGAENIDPYINTQENPMPAFRFAFVSGEVVDKNLCFNAVMAEGEVAPEIVVPPYVAGNTFTFEGSKVTE